MLVQQVVVNIIRRLTNSNLLELGTSSHIYLPRISFTNVGKHPLVSTRFPCKKRCLKVNKP